MTGYVVAALAALTLAGGGYGYAMQRHNRTLALELAVGRGELATCGARLQNLIEDVRADHAIDDLPDSALVLVPPHWMRP